MTSAEEAYLEQFPEAVRPGLRALLAKAWTRIYGYPNLDTARAAYRVLFEQVGNHRQDIGMVTAMLNHALPVLAIHSFEPIDEQTEAIIAAGIGVGERLPDNADFARTMNQRRIGQMLEAMQTGEAIEVDKASGKVLRLHRTGIWQHVDSEGRNIG